MKNIHVLPTDKPSRLYYNTELPNNFIHNANNFPLHEDLIKDKFKPQHIYITNSEEIKDGEYGICLTLVKEGFKSHQAVFLMDLEQREAMEELGGQKRAEVYKVILTTDQDLIKDGVQAIDDEFLSFFAENPVDYVRVEKWLDDEGGRFYYLDFPQKELKETEQKLYTEEEVKELLKRFAPHIRYNHKELPHTWSQVVQEWFAENKK